MPHTIELDETTLKYLHYHWLWGLQYSNTPHPKNLHTKVDELLHDKEQLTRIIASQQSLYQRHAVVRFFYWLFNINNYCCHYYVIAAYQAHQDYLSRSLENTPTKTEVPQGNRVIAFLKAFAHQLIQNYGRAQIPVTSTVEPIEPAASSSTDSVSSGQSNASVSSPPSPPVRTQTITVTAVMKPHLEVLGISLNVGDLLALSDFKAACKARFLTSHPDKGGTAEEFCQVKKAVDDLTHIMSSQSSSSTEDWMSFYETINEIRAGIAEIRATNATLRIGLATLYTSLEETNAIRKETNVIREEANVIREEANVIRARTEATIEEINTIRARTEATVEETNAIRAKTDATREETNRLVTAGLAACAEAIAKLQQERMSSSEHTPVVEAPTLLVSHPPTGLISTMGHFAPEPRPVITSPDASNTPATNGPKSS